MLPPFRIKGIVGHPLNRKRLSRKDDRSSAVETPDNQHSAAFEIQGDGVVQVSASEYDETISDLPEAKLRYQDDDDGEIVVVGSALELSQLIGELLPSSYRLPPSTLNAVHNPGMHTFEIQQTLPAVHTWRDFRWRTVSNSFAGLPSGQTTRIHSQPLDDRNRTAGTLPVPMSSAAMSSAPLRPGPNVASSLHNSYLKTIASMDGKEPRDSNILSSGSGVTKTGSDASLEPSIEGSKPMTEKGGKEAHAAERRFQDFHRSRSPELSEASAAGDHGIFSDISGPEGWITGSPCTIREEREPHSSESPITLCSKPLLSSFEKELSRLMEDNERASPATTQGQAMMEYQDPVSFPAVQETAKPRDEPETRPSTLPPRNRDEGTPYVDEGIHQIVSIFGHSLQSLLSHANTFTSELTARLPELERSVTHLQYQLPEHMQNTIHETLHAMGAHAQQLSGIMQQAATSARLSSIATSEAEKLVTVHLNNLRAIASDIRKIGSSLLTPPAQEAKPEVFPECPEAEPETRSLNPEPALEAVESSATNIFIGNLPLDATEDLIITALTKLGFVGAVSLPKDSLTGDHAGFCYVNFPSTHAASGALQALKGAFIENYRINVEPASDLSKQVPSATVELFEDSNAHLTPELSSRPDVPERPHMSWNLPVSELDNETSSIPRGHHESLTASQAEPVRKESSEQPATNTALLDESEVNLADRYPSLLSFQSNDGEEPVFERNYTLPNSLPEASSYDFSVDRYPSMSQLESQPFVEHVPQPAQVRGIPRTRATVGSSGSNAQGQEQHINHFHRDESSSTPVTAPLPGSWPRDQELQQFGTRDMRSENPNAHGISHIPSRQNRLMLSDISEPFTPFPPSLPPSNTSNASLLRRSATERVRRHHLRSSEFHQPRSNSTRRRFSTHELAENISDRENSSTLPGTFPRELTSVSAEPPLNDRTELCLSQLRTLGFGDDRSQDENRLRIFAEAADGNLEEAIEMIEEERKAYEQGPVPL